MAVEQLSLGQLLWSVRRELEWARAQDSAHAVRFEVETVELDVTVEANASTTGEGGLNLTVVGVGAQGKLSRESAHSATTTLHVVLKPIDLRTSGGRLQVGASRERPLPRATREAGPEDDLERTADPFPERRGD